MAEIKPVACPRVELVVALHTLASHFENALYAFRDDAEALRKAKGDIAHAMTIAARHNQNGTGCTALEAARAEERERCAKLADEYATWGGSNFYDWFRKLGAAIRNLK